MPMPDINRRNPLPLQQVAERGVQGALAKLDDLVEQAVASVPDCEGAQEMRDLVRMTAMRLAPKQLSRSAA